MAGSVANLERINALAERSPGFVCSLEDEVGDATATRPFGANVLVNMSVWQRLESLHDYAFRANRLPTVQEAAERLAHLRTHGPTHHAFTFRDAFPPPDDNGNASAVSGA
jgi:hypothetical protein